MQYRLGVFHNDVVFPWVIFSCRYISWHDRMIIEENERETMLEDTFEAVKTGWSLNKKMKGHYIATKVGRSKIIVKTPCFQPLGGWRRRTEQIFHEDEVLHRPLMKIKDKATRRRTWHFHLTMKSLSSLSSCDLYQSHHNVMCLATSFVDVIM